MSDLVIRQGDTTPAFVQTLLDASGNPLDLTGSSVVFVMRAITAAAPTVEAAATINDPINGVVEYDWSTADTAVSGIYAAEFHVTDASGGTYTYPNNGYLEISVEQNLTTPGGATLVSLGEAREYLNFMTTDKSRDAKLLRFIDQIRPVVEFITGPIIVQQYDELYDGGQHFVRLRHRPIVQIIAVSEFRGPIEYNLPLVQDAAHGEIYSVELDDQRLVRRSAGGGIIAFPAMPQAVHVVYTAGFLTVPPNVTLGTLELIRLHFQQTQQGRPRLGGSAATDTDGEEPGRMILGFFVPNRVRELLQPSKKHSSIA